jgi:hypothetical protein
VGLRRSRFVSLNWLAQPTDGRSTRGEAAVKQPGCREQPSCLAYVRTIIHLRGTSPHGDELEWRRLKRKAGEGWLGSSAASPRNPRNLWARCARPQPLLKLHSAWPHAIRGKPGRGVRARILNVYRVITAERDDHISCNTDSSIVPESVRASCFWPHPPAYSVFRVGTHSLTGKREHAETISTMEGPLE